MSVVDWLGPHGRFSATLPGFESRPGQLQMALAIEAALEHSGTLLVEAGGGGGAERNGGNDRAAAEGHILLMRLQVRGAAGFVTDGSVRDSAPVATLPLPAIDAAVRRVFDDGAYLRARPCMSPLSDDRDPTSVVASPRMSGVRWWILSH